MRIHSGHFGLIASFSAVFASFLLLYFALRALRSWQQLQAQSSSTLIKTPSVAARLFQSVGFALFVFVPLLLTVVFGYTIHWIHDLIRPITYGQRGIESSYEYGTQLLALGIGQALVGLYLASQRKASNGPSDSKLSSTARSSK